MRPGRMIAVVGPSGVGKDSLMQGIKAHLPDVHLIKRVITREPGCLGEIFTATDEDSFQQMIASGAFALHWQAHGLHYGIPKTQTTPLAQGRDCLVNLSRGALTEAALSIADLVVIHVTADRDILAQRLARRDRETAVEIKNRLARAAKPLPDGIDVFEIQNNGALSEAVQKAVDFLQSTRATP